MAFARLIFRILLVILVLLVAIGLLLPTSASVERSIVIDAPAERIFPRIDAMRAVHAWSPWAALDPSTQYAFDGPERGVGSRMTWQSGDAAVGSGSQEITASMPPHEVETRLEFGGEREGRARFVLEPLDDGTRVRWRFETEFGWDLLSRYVGLMLDDMIGAAYDQGLRELKRQVESDDPA
jgi:hypothetical protein